MATGYPTALEDSVMYAESLPKIWIVLGAYGIAAVLCLIHAFKLVSSPHLPQVAGLIVMVGLTVSIYSRATRGSLNRTLGQIRADIEAGRQRRMTPLEKVSVLLAGALVVITTIQMNH